jgi:hypothetical protein
VSVKYLLPCACGQPSVVEPRQAGEMIVCSCGASLQAPTLLAMTRLEPAPTESNAERPAATWGWKQRLRLMGIVLLLVALVGGAGLWLHWPSSPFDRIDPEYFHKSAKKMPVSKAWDYWEGVQQGLDRRTDQRYAAAVERFRVGEAALGVIGLAGAALLAAGLVTGQNVRAGDKG